MVDVRYHALIATTAILFFGTAYSVYYSTYLDTSNPLLTHLPHKLSETHYFASKSNPLNVYFIKKSWGWTTLVFLFSYLTSPVQIRTKERLGKYLVLTGAWLLFTSWFFGPALLDRFIVYSGGECLYQLPNGEFNSLPVEVCYAKSAIAPQTHPEFFLSSSESIAAPLFPDGWRATPRLRKGHDLSGHVFLLTMSTLFLADQLRASFIARQRWTATHMWAVAANISLMGIWFLGSYTTSVYFHSPFEKFTGYLLGVACFAFTLLPIFGGQSQLQAQSQPQTLPRRD